MHIKMKNKSNRYDINRPRSGHGHKYSKYKKFLNMMMLICIMQHLSNIWSSTHEKPRLSWEKSVYIAGTDCLVKQRVSIYRQHVRQLQYQQLAVEEHLCTCGDGKFYLFPFFTILQENKSLRKSYQHYFRNSNLSSIKRLNSQNLLK